ncbi:hypothetical protein [Photobacterium phosphoreum]|uniref:hypothetical protein n=1 Tax=Photobacterium phosphoreum TaxID=659 RepID=UPI000D185464|nr:hypothetical protein [Photobacterium phosphoreum]PSU36562.1 hypothetical protein CTM85_16865 [Photobacterium phosphoreum]
MDARFLGFSIDFKSEKLTLDSMMNMLSSQLAHQAQHEQETGNSRVLYFNKDHHSDFYIGMVVTIRNQKKFCRGVKVESGDFTFDVLNLSRADKILEFNYFIINKESGLGLYQHYHHSCAARIFGKMLKQLSAQYSKSCGDAAIIAEEAKYPSQELSKHKKSLIRKPYGCDLNFSILVRKEKLKDILLEFSKIKSFEFEYATLTPEVKAATPLSSFVIKKKEVLRFHNPNDVLGLAAAISGFASMTSLRSGRIKVENEVGDEFPLHIFNMPDYFAIYDFDELADKLKDVKASEFYKSKLVDDLLETYLDEQYNHIFQVMIHNED